MIWALIILVAAVSAVLLGRTWPKVMAVVMLPAVIALMAAAGYFSGVVAAVAASAVLPFGLTAVLLTRPLPDIEQPHHGVARQLLWVSLFVFVLAGTVGVLPTPPSGMVGILFLLIFIAMVVRYGIRTREAVAFTVLSTIGAGIRQNLPLPGCLQAAAIGRNDKAARIMNALADRLSEGLRLSEALDLAYPRCPSFARAAIAAAEPCGQFAPALECIRQDMAEKTQNASQGRAFEFYYPFVILAIMGFVLLGLMIVVIPRFEHIFDMMGVGLPLVTRILMGASGLAASYFVPILGVFVLAGVALVVRKLTRLGKPAVPDWLTRWIDWLTWHLPGWHGFQRDQSRLRTTYILRLGLQAGCSVDQVIERAAGADVNHCYRKRLQHWGQLVRAGGDIAGSAREARVGRTLAWAFDQYANPANTPAALAVQERLYRSNCRYRLNLIASVFWPVMVMVVGVLVGIVVLGIFMPMVCLLAVMS